jgi:hypothetical protein
VLISVESIVMFGTLGIKLIVTLVQVPVPGLLRKN